MLQSGIFIQKWLGVIYSGMVHLESKWNTALNVERGGKGEMGVK